MKKKSDVYFIYFVFILNILLIFGMTMYINYGHPPIGEPLSFNMNTLIYIMIIFLLYSFFVLPFIYALIMIYKIKQNEEVDLKKNSYLLLIFFIIDLMFHSFNITAVIQTSFALKFIVLSLLIHVLFFIKYRTVKIHL